MLPGYRFQEVGLGIRINGVLPQSLEAKNDARLTPVQQTIRS